MTRSRVTNGTPDGRARWREERASAARTSIAPEVTSPAHSALPSPNGEIDVVLAAAVSLLSEALDLSAALGRLGELIVPPVADWCGVAVEGRGGSVTPLAFARASDALSPDVVAAIDGSFSVWLSRGTDVRGAHEAERPCLVSRVSEAWLRARFAPRAVFDAARRAGVRSLLVLPIALEGRRLGTLLLLRCDPARPRFGEDDRRAAARYAVLAAAAIRQGRLLETLTRELARRKVVEESLRESMATIGTLSSGLGHDMANLLHVLRLRLDSLRAMELSSRATSDLRAIGDVMGYLQRLTNGLRLLAGDTRGNSPETGVTRLASWWRDVESLMRGALAPGITLHCVFPERLPPVRIPAVALTQILFNLVQNAGQALEGKPGGVIRVSAARLRGREHVQLFVRDNGPGMNEESVRRCFEPYFSARERPGSGLGLTLVRNLVHRARGEITLESPPGEGTVFCITLPLAEPRHAAPRGGRGRPPHAVLAGA